MSTIFQSDETVKDGLLLFQSDPHAVILKRDAKVNFTTDTNLHTAPSIFHRIAEEISQDLLDLFVIMAERRLAVFSGNSDENPVVFQEGSRLSKVLCAT
jgi:hypothetical protein